MKLTEFDTSITMAAKPSSSSSTTSSHLNRSVLVIDLNQVPSPSETLPSPSSSSSTFILSPTSLVRSIHDNPNLPEGLPAEIPNGVDVLPCAVCGCSSAFDSDRLVCDGCERGFHFSCTGFPLPSTVKPEDWLCRFCVADGVSSNRWQLGRKEDRAVRLIDMNASPPSDGDGEALVTADAAAAAGSRNFCFSNNTFGSGLLSYPNFVYSGNGFGFQKASAIVTHTVKLGFQDILHSKLSSARGVDDIKYGSQLGRHRSSGTAFRLPSWNSSEVLQSLKEFVSERHGVLDEGWRVEFKQSKNGCESYAVYCAPDGKMFETMSDVASYLGLTYSGNSLELETRSDYNSTLHGNGLHLPKRRKVMKIPVGNGFLENKGNFSCGYNNGSLSNFQKEHFMSKPDKSIEIMASLPEENCAADLHHFHEGLPLQYEDFFVLSLGEVDARISYHDSCQIWPVGYRSCWHDKVTGSLFLCHVLDGGDAGPVFKVRRVSCSAIPIPYGSTVLQRQRGTSLNGLSKEVGDKTNFLEEESTIEMLLADPCFPPEDDSLSWLLSSPIEVDGQKVIHSSSKIHSSSERSQDVVAHNLSTGERLGEFSVDGRSSSLLWSILSQKLADTCRQIYKQKGSLKFFCKHVEDGMSSLYDIMAFKNRNPFSSLDKFCSLLGSLKVPLVVKSDEELDSTLEALKSWLSLDRFGLDAEFVQELIEQSPDVHRCEHYESLGRRNDCLRLPLVRNGLLLFNGKNIEQCKHDSLFYGLYKDYRTTEEPASSIHNRPAGTDLGAKLQPHLVGDVLQVWELLRRFHEILGLESLKFDELEEELINPWFESLSMHVSCERDSPGGQIVSADGSSILSEHTSASSSEVAHPGENGFVEMQSASLREDANANQALSTYRKCTGISLRRAHISLLDVLVSELQIKVAAMVDPSIDAESKSRRGRRRDVDSSILAIRPKLNLLPINELTWPELTRRYILSVLSMDGNLDSADTVMRECGKVLRCLQGDGGVLCGSLVGVAGIEADALLLAEAKKRIFGCVSSVTDHLTIEEDDPEPIGTSGKIGNGDGSIPEWAQALEPVRKLPTNVGTRIRKCVYEALNKDPPDWARKTLEHSISKAVYKGNASGPTKKAVLSVLADVLSEGSHQKTPEERKKKMVLSISDTVMRKCRILLRQAASADEEKVFCNLVGRNLIHSSENDDDGLLGSPGMISRPLDFRTIDLRLAFGAYSGSHEAFLEDVRELWNNIRVAHAEQLELVQLAERLSENFESLYEEEVVALVERLKEYSEMEQINAEAKKEIKDVLASTSDIPKAPWDEGVCKVCGIDKDDDSVLLCDSCDAEYHTYCLNPPLARIPEGNWYCPSCVSGVSVLERTSKGFQYIGPRHRRKNHGEGVQNYLEELARLAAVMEQKEYSEFSVDEKILLLKFLCDEVLNSILIRQHLEQCFETSADLQQKLRVLYSELKNLKLQEDTLATTATKVCSDIPIVAGDAERKIGKVDNHSICAELQHGITESNHVPSVSDNAQTKGEVGSLHSIFYSRCRNVKHLEKNKSGDIQVKQSMDSDTQVKGLVPTDDDENTSCENHGFRERSSKRHKSSSFQACLVLNDDVPETSGIDSKSVCQGKECDSRLLDLSAVCRSEDLEGVSVSPGPLNIEAAETVVCLASKEVQASNLKHNSVQKELSGLQQSIANVESQLMMSSVRMEYLGCDSSGRLYWASAQSGAHPRVIVDGTMALQPISQHAGYGSMVSAGINDSHLSLEGSRAGCPFVNGTNSSHPTCSRWVYYQSEEELKELVMSLKLNNPKERELKDSILNWHKLRSHELHHSGKHDKAPSSMSISPEENDKPGALVTRADTVLEHKYGPFFQADMLEDVKKRLRRSKGTSDEKLYRCRCLEPVWLSRYHCFSCHRTFYTVEELDSHSNGKCRSSSTIPRKRKESGEPLGGRTMKKSEAQQHFSMTKDRVQACKNADSDLSRYTKFLCKDSMCPYKFEDISSKFVTNDSIKEVVCGIGLIGSDGTPSIVPSMSPYLNDPTLRIVVSNQDITADVDQCKIPEQAVGQNDQPAGKSCIVKVDPGARRVMPNKHDETTEAGLLLPGFSREKSKKIVGSNFVSFTITDPYCMVPESSLKPVAARGAQILRQLKICLLDMEAALPEEALRPSKVHLEKRRAWQAFVKESETIFEMVQATIVLEDMIKADYLKNERWYWSSLSAAAKTSTLSSLALRIYALDNSIVYEKPLSDLTYTGSLKPGADVDQQSPSNLDSSEKSKQGRRTSRRRRDAEG
ncbi:methyl-CpG-binding domain-containing protein 9 isoform X2 [Amaranthus tricolor]|uniref:methyl-CpG-binding domain-containing protein 9 isoform X2 n=1 Tax=Amaranthus tricolor TaxID=29722 RepID=UPI0025855643|nr:methyl-CpG-binding domain-containing protein 9 isoform X2 [Amaranthus tricolor]